MRLGLCNSSRQRALAQSLAARLERNLGIGTLIVEDDSAPVSATWDQASACDAVLLLLDAVSAPGATVNRLDWEALLEHAGAPPVALVRLESCRYPKLLERRRLFLAADSPIEAERWVEQWLAELLLPRDEAGLAAAAIDSTPPPDEWWTQLVDQPGVGLAAAGDIDAAQEFARQAGRHFQGVHWIGCERRPAPAILDEVAHWARGATRLLFILVHHTGVPLELPGVDEGGRHSYLILEGAPPPAESADPLARWVGVCRAAGFPGSLLDLMLGSPRAEWESLVTVLDRERDLYRPRGRYVINRRASQRHLEVLEEAFRHWRLKPERCRPLLSEVPSALRYGFECNSPAARALGLEFALFLVAEKRNAEAVGWLRLLVEEAERESDSAIALRARSELSWLVDDGGTPVPDVAEVGDQLSFAWT